MSTMLSSLPPCLFYPLLHFTKVDWSPFLYLTSTAGGGGTNSFQVPAINAILSKTPYMIDGVAVNWHAFKSLTLQRREADLEPFLWFSKAEHSVTCHCLHPLSWVFTLNYDLLKVEQTFLQYKLDIGPFPGHCPTPISWQLLPFACFANRM